MEKITKKPKISLYQDTRKSTTDGTYPIRIQVYFGTQRYFFTGKRLSLEDFENSYKTQKPKGDRLKELKIELAAIEAKANEVADELKVFTFEKFEKLLFAAKQSLTNIIDHYNSYIKILDKNEQTGTSSSYSCSINSIKEYINFKRKNPIEAIPFDMITVDFLNNYENWMIAQDNSRTTVGIYLRATRKIFNQAIEDGIIDKEIYPLKKPLNPPTLKNCLMRMLRIMFFRKRQKHFGSLAINATE